MEVEEGNSQKIAEEEDIQLFDSKAAKKVTKKKKKVAESKTGKN